MCQKKMFLSSVYLTGNTRFILVPKIFPNVSREHCVVSVSPL